jgi:hypothetical protein
LHETARFYESVAEWYTTADGAVMRREGTFTALIYDAKSVFQPLPLRLRERIFAYLWRDRNFSSSAAHRR